MIWRLAIVGSYVALAIVVGIAYGGRGLAILSFFYFWAGAWGAFLLVWGWAARAAGRWNVERSTPPRPGSRRDGSGPGAGETRPADALEAAAERASRRRRAAARRRPAPAL